MSDLRRQFLESSVQTLHEIVGNLQAEKSFSEKNQRQIFRHIHTIKGTAQSFGLSRSANLAHSLENLLSAANNDFKKNQWREILIEGLDLLGQSLQNPHFEIPPDFTSKLEKSGHETITDRAVLFSFIPTEVFEKLTEFEKNKIASALRDDKCIYRLDVSFDYADFSEEFRKFQDLVNEKGEIIFTLPAEAFDSTDRIGFQVYFSSLEAEEHVKATVRDYNAHVIWLNPTAVFADDLHGVALQIAAQGEKLGQILGKTVEFSVLSDKPKLSPQTLKLIFDVLLHLVKNSIDHSIVKKGKIEIRLQEENKNLRLSVTDDGRGIDLEKVRAKAIDKNLILPETKLSERETLDLIFLPGFSTAEKITEISGRGVGLDAVKELVTNAGGTVGIETQKGKGTTFEIFLPCM